MAHRWLLKSDPSTYSRGDPLRDRVTAWDGIRNLATLADPASARLGLVRISRRSVMPVTAAGSRRPLAPGDR